MEIRSGIHRIEARFAGRYLFQHLLIGERILLIDTGVADTPEAVIFPYLESIGRDRSEIDYVLCTHPDADHLGGNSVVRQVAPGCRILGHTLDVRWLEDPDAMVAERYGGFRAEHAVGDEPEALMASRRLCGDPTSVDIALCGGESIAISEDWRVEIVHTPGHSAGHVSVWDPRSRTLLIADAAMGRALPHVDGSAALAATYTHPGPYALTSERLAARGAELLLTAHFPAMESDAIVRHFADSRGLVDDVDTAVHKAIAAAPSPIGLRELIDVVDARLGPLPDETRDTWASPVSGHLDALEANGSVSVVHDGGRKLYSNRSGTPRTGAIRSHPDGERGS